MLRLVLFLTLILSVAFAESSTFSLDNKRKGHSPDDIFFMPLGSLFIPGLGQINYNQYGAGATYLAIGGFGLYTGMEALSGIEEQEGLSTDDLDTRDERLRRAIWGFGLYSVGGGLSLYHSFRTAVQTRQERGEFQFLGEGETTPELMLSPFRLSHLGKWTTLIPLGILAGGLAIALANDDYETRSPDKNDMLFTAGVSYNAGVWEEAVFRGWMLPLLTDTFDSPFLANVATSTLFAAAHISEENKVPWPQFVFSMYMGVLTKKRNWTLSEAIFIHTWWDIIAFTAIFAEGRRKSSIYVPIFQGQF